MKVNLSILISVTTLLLLNCSNKEDSEWFSGDFYSNDKSKLAAEIIDENIGFKFFPPLNWSIQSAELSKKIESKNKFKDADQKSFSYAPIYLFFNKETGSLLSIGIVDYTDTSATLESKMNIYKNLLTNKYKDDKLSIGVFTKSGIKFTQLKSEKENFINYKIIFNNNANKIIQLDCTIRKDNLKSERESLKATIGSIQLLKPI